MSTPRPQSFRSFVRQVVGALAHPLGRAYIRFALHRALWPAVRPIAGAWRAVALRRVQIVAVVGSFGKTTTTRAIQAALGLPVPPGPGGCNHSYLARELFRIRPWQRWAVLEVGIERPGEMRPMARMVRPDVTVVTSIGSEHITSMKSLERTRREKFEMIAAMKDGGVAVLNGDDPNVVWMAGQTPARAVTFGEARNHEVEIVGSSLDWPRGTRFCLRVAGADHEVDTGMFGRHWGRAVAAAVAAAGELGVSPADAARRLAGLRPSVARLETIRLPSGAWVIRDDFKSAPETVEAALDLLGEIPARRKIAIVGEISEMPAPRGDGLRAVGRRVADVATIAIFLGSRKECRLYATGARSASMDEASVHRAFHSVEAAHAAIPRDLGEGDVILMKASIRDRLERIVHLLRGEPMRCFIPMCVAAVPCAGCPKRTTGWRAGETPPIPNPAGPLRRSA